MEIILLIPILLLSLSFHEYSHGKVSNMLGDPTPKIMGRLTLNPLAHLDLLGSLTLIITRRIGWAKPVPINPRYYKNPRQGMMLVGLAGPAANAILALLFSIILKIVLNSAGLNIDSELKIYGSHPISVFTEVTINFIFLAIIINLSLFVFNLLPLPPLDGSKILAGFLPPRFDRYFYQLEGPLGMFIIMILAISGVLGNIIGPIIYFFLNLLL